MPWAPHDLSVWSFILAIAALMLALPISLAANATTPKIKDRLAERSEESLKERIAKLESELAAKRTLPEMGEAESHILLAALGAGLLGLLIMLVMVVFLTFPVAPRGAGFWVVLDRLYGLIGLFGAVGVYWAFIRPGLKLWIDRSGKSRDDLEKNIVRLKIKLETMKA
jgi:hypothetical protein